jgi:beta-N-acetylhexosaminidase
MANTMSLVWGALMPGVSTHPVEPWVLRAIDAGVESVCLFADAVGSIERTRDTVDRLRRANPRLLVATDEEGGEVTRLEPLVGSSVLSPLALGVIDDEAVTRATGRRLATMLRSVGIDWTFAPVADVNVDPCNPVIGVRSFGGEAGAVARHVAAFVEGVQGRGVAATAKHFPGHGDTHVDSHEALPTVSASGDVLSARELAPFRAAVTAGVASVMTGHLLVPSLDPEAPASLSAAVTTRLLRQEFGFSGVVVTDAVEMGAVSGPRRERLAAAVVAALRAGADVVCLGAADQESALESAVLAVQAALDSGEVDIRTLEAAARRRAALRVFTSANVAPIDAAVDDEIIAGAAAGALVVTGDIRLTGRGIDVLRIAAPPGYAAGETRWGVATPLGELLSDVREIEGMPQGTDRDLVVEVRDAWKQPALVARLDAVCAVRPDAVVVDMGWPMPTMPSTRGSLTTHGTGDLIGAVAAAVLAASDPRRSARSVLAATRLEHP